jgi:hypothetical protein
VLFSAYSHPFIYVVGPLALLISNKFTSFYCFVINRSLHQILNKGAKVDFKPSEEVDPCQVRSTALTVPHKEQRSNADPVSPRLTRIP